MKLTPTQTHQTSSACANHMICLGIAGEYLGRVYVEVKRMPLYLVVQRWGFDDPAL